MIQKGVWPITYIYIYIYIYTCVCVCALTMMHVCIMCICMDVCENKLLISVYTGVLWMRTIICARVSVVSVYVPLDASFIPMFIGLFSIDRSGFCVKSFFLILMGGPPCWLHFPTTYISNKPVRSIYLYIYIYTNVEIDR